jgi:hypothetical protein
MFMGDGKRAQIIEASIIGPLAFTDDGRLIHIRTGRLIPPPEGVPVRDNLAYARHLLAEAPYEWDEAEKFFFGNFLPPYLRTALAAARASYPGDAKVPRRRKTA